MIWRSRAAVALALACFGFAVATASLPSKGERRERSGPIPARAFLTQSKLVDVEISPNGLAVAWLQRDGASNSLWLLDTRSARRRKLARHSEATNLHWSSDGRWLFLESARTIAAMSPEESGSGGVLSLLGGETGRSILGVDRSRAAAMIVREAVVLPGHRAPSSFRVLRLSPAESAELLFASKEPVDQFIAGTPGFVRVVAGDHFSIRRVDGVQRSREVLRCVRLEQCSLLSSPARGELVLTGDVAGNFERLLRLGGDGRLHTLHQDPAGVSDIAAVGLDPRSGEPLLAHYRSGQAADHAVGPAAAPHVSAIRSQLASGSSFRAGLGSALWLIAETGDRLQHPRWHLYDPRTRLLREILADVERTSRTVAAAADRIPISFPASDGMLIHGFLALPPGRQPSKLPLLVHVHGGPWSHVEDGYSTIAQFLVSRGYAVFEPNFRGSTGYGRAYMVAGGQDFGNGRVQQDIVEGTRHLLQRGIGDPERVGIIGSSFGGYSALQGVTFTPDLFRVAIAAMPPPDFGWVIDWQVRREAAAGHEGIGLHQLLRQLGMDPADGALLRKLSAQSPLHNAARLTRPVLIIAGGEDRSVPIRSVTHYAARLKSLGRAVSLFVDPKSGHRLDDPEAQQQYLILISRMLQRELGGSAERLPDSRTWAKLRRKLRLDDLRLGSLSQRSVAGGKSERSRGSRI